MKPTRLTFGRLSYKDPCKPRTIKLTRGDGGPLNLKLLPIKTEAFTAELSEIEPGEHYELAVTLSRPYLSDRIRGNVKLETGVPEAPTVDIPIFAQITPRLSSSPRKLSVPRTRTSDWEGSVRLVWSDTGQEKIISATVNDAELSVEVREGQKQQEVVLKVPADYKPGTYGRQLTIKTEDADAPILRVPIRFTKTRPDRFSSRRKGTELRAGRKAKAGTEKPAASKPAPTAAAPTGPAPAKPTPTEPEPAKPAAPEPETTKAASTEPPPETPAESEKTPTAE